MDDERSDQTREQFNNDEIQGEAASSGYPEEQPSGDVPDSGADGSVRRRSGAEPTDEPDSRPGSSGEGTQSTGNPHAAG